MPIFSEAAVIEILDGIACGLMAASATWKASSLRATLVGATVLGCICGVIAPLLREIILHGETGSRLIVSALANDALIGSLAGLAAIRILKSPVVFFIIDRSAVFLTSCLAALVIAGELGLSAALIAGIVCGFMPLICRDAALGDSCEFVEKEWFAAAAIIGCIATLIISILPFFFGILSFLEARIIEWSIVLGVIIALGFDLWKGNKPFNY